MSTIKVPASPELKERLTYIRERRVAGSEAQAVRLLIVEESNRLGWGPKAPFPALPPQTPSAAAEKRPPTWPEHWEWPPPKRPEEPKMISIGKGVNLSLEDENDSSEFDIDPTECSDGPDSE